ncbi:MAG: hypothetical protein WC635_12205 [Bacteriovorax sp.]|jgi:hypothetical protein
MSLRKKWKRISGHSRTDDYEFSSQARLADPYWMLYRQMQFGAFQAENAASPIKIQMDYVSLKLDRYNDKIINQNQNLRSQIEKESFSLMKAYFKFSAEAGLLFLKYFKNEEKGLLKKTLRRNFALTNRLDLLKNDEYFDFLMNVSFDSSLLYNASESKLRTIAAEAYQVWDTFNQNVSDWKTAHQTKFAPENSPAWQRETFNYSAQIASAGGKLENSGQTANVMLNLNTNGGAHLDWYHFSVDEKSVQNNKFENNGTFTCMPAKVRYAGMPQDTYWHFEESKVYLGRLQLDERDLTQTLIGEFATIFSNDWFMAVLPLQTNAITRLQKVTVTDSFGDTKEIAPGRGTEKWRYFELSNDLSGTYDLAPWLLTLPNENSIASENEVEKITFMKDEINNLAWASEDTIESETGKRINRNDESPADTTANAATGPTPDDGIWVYRFLSKVPANKIPFLVLPTEVGRLTRGHLPGVPIGAKGEIIGGTGKVQIRQNEILGTGIEVTKKYHLARGLDGGVVLWSAKQKTVASNNSLPNFQYDTLETK